MYKQRLTFLCFYALNILLKSSRCPFIKIEVSLDNLKILSLQSQFWSILKRARTFYSDNVHTFKDRLIVVLQHHWSAAFILCDLCCFFGINQVLFELCKTESQFLVPWRVNTGTMFNFCVEIICWKMQSSRSASCSKTPPGCYPEQEKKKMNDFKELDGHLGKKWSLQNSLNLFGPLCSFDLRLRRKLWIQS